VTRLRFAGEHSEDRLKAGGERGIFVRATSAAVLAFLPLTRFKPTPRMRSLGPSVMSVGAYLYAAEGGHGLRRIEIASTSLDSLVATLPLLKPNGDVIEVGIQSTGSNGFRLSDLGETYATLYLAGVDLLEEYVRGEEFRQVVIAHKITDSEKELSVETSSGQLVERLFDFVHAIQSMLALQLTVKPQQEKRDFSAIVARFLAEQGASFEIPERVDGKTGRWKFNFILNHVREETLVKALTATSRAQALRSAEQSMFEIRDVKEIRETDAVVIADDEGFRREYWSPATVRIFEGYDVPVFGFQGQKEKLSELAAKYRLKT
jgi:hypothetical protein